MASKSKSKREETQAFLDELEADLTEPSPSVRAGAGGNSAAATTTTARTAAKTGKKRLTGATATPAAAAGSGAGSGKKDVSPAGQKESDDHPVPAAAARVATPTTERSATPRLSTDTVPTAASEGKPTRTSIDTASTAAATAGRGEKGEGKGDDPEADLAFLEAQLRVRPAVGAGGSRPVTPAAGGGGATIGTVLQAPTGPTLGGRKSLDGPSRSRTGTPVNEPTAAGAPATGGAAGAGWGSSWWSSASTIINTAKTVAREQVAHVARQADEVQLQARDVVAGATASAGPSLQGLVGGVTAGVGAAGNLESLAKGGLDSLGQLREQLGDRVKKGVDLDKLRSELLQRGQSALSEIINTVAPPISEHEVLQVWFSHDMKGYDGVENVVYSAVENIMRQTESTDLELFYSSPKPKQDRTSTDSKRSSTASGGEAERSINPVEGWDTAWEKTQEMMRGVKERMKVDPRKGHPNHKTSSASSLSPSKHLTFLVTLHDDVHSLQFSTVTQYAPADWMEVPYEVSDWVEERLVDVLRNGVENIVQEYVATRMNLKQLPGGASDSQTMPAAAGDESEEVTLEAAGTEAK
ncbi:hypothetical protein QFC19_008547 [Naganishia cerealis]|uniref:Uncharacterized protein n=1 Tax=Naganishia cerealis TaxID=610337 RepID=A0ACC2V0T2_9TREE|nr:hypothetical protein QFC19_008547 [Naganishia cerealis]